MGDCAQKVEEIPPQAFSTRRLELYEGKKLHIKIPFWKWRFKQCSTTGSNWCDGGKQCQVFKRSLNGAALRPEAPGLGFFPHGLGVRRRAGRWPGAAHPPVAFHPRWRGTSPASAPAPSTRPSGPAGPSAVPHPNCAAPGRSKGRSPGPDWLKYIRAF